MAANMPPPDTGGTGGFQDNSDNPLDWLEDMCGAAGWSFERLSDSEMTIVLPSDAGAHAYPADISYDARHEVLQITLEVAAIPSIFLEEERRQTLNVLLDAVNLEVESGSFRALNNGLMIYFTSMLPKSECAEHVKLHSLTELFANYAKLCTGYQLVFGLLAQKPDDTPTAAAHILHLLKPMGTA